MFKEQFLEDLVLALSPRSILDLGSGTSGAFAGLLAAHPEIQYTGLEPYEPSARKARELLAGMPNARIVDGLAYDAADYAAGFDLVISLSVLEHVKQLEKFLAMSVAACKPGGRIVHWYDLGHALHPSGAKERFQVFLGNTFPWILPELKYVSYVDAERVKRLLAKHGATVSRTSYRQMANHKTFTNLAGEGSVAVAGLVQWERENADVIDGLPFVARERLFPSVVVEAAKG